jgi:tetratricopeptide (TPR) repeat protein
MRLLGLTPSAQIWPNGETGFSERQQRRNLLALRKSLCTPSPDPVPSPPSHPNVKRRPMRFPLFVALALSLGTVNTVHDAAAGEPRKAHATSRPAQTTALQTLGDRQLCDGGVLIPAPDQARGCSRLIAGRYARSLKAVAHYNRANARMRMSQVSAAIEDYTDAIRLDPQMREAFFNRAIAHQSVGATQAALADLDTLLRLVPSDADALVARARIHLKLGKAESAGSDVEKALATAPNDIAARLVRAHLRARLHDWPTALSDYERVLQANPRDTEALYGRGLVRTWSGTPREGAEDMRLALMLDPTAADRLATLGLRLGTETTAMTGKR